MIDNFYRTKTTLTIINKDDYGFEISAAKEVNNIFQGFSTKIQIEYAKMLDDYIYKNIPTNEQLSLLNQQQQELDLL